MFRSVRIQLAPLATLKPVLAVSVASQNTVIRFVGHRSNLVPNVTAINSVIEKTKGEGLAGTAALVTRAALYTAAHNPKAAIAEIDNVLPKIQDEAVKRLAVGIKLHARNELLDVTEAALSVSGGATESEVSQIRTDLKKDYAALQESSTGCWLVQLAAAEFSLYTGNVDEAYEQFCDVESKIKAFINAPIELSETVATPENTNPFSLLGFKIKRSFNTRGAEVKVHNKAVGEGVAAISDEPSIAAELEEFKKTMGVALTNEEATEVALALHAANVRHHFHHFFPSTHFHYDDWASPTAQHALKLVDMVETPASCVLPEGTVAKVRAAVPANAFYVPNDKLRAVLKSAPKDQSMISSIRAAFGPGPQTPLSTADETLNEALDSLKTAGASQDMAGTIAYAKRQKEAAKVLAHQILYRTQVMKGVALIEKNQLHDAVDVITPVINANEFIYMWRAFLARSRAYKGLGLITNSDKDEKALKHLKVSLTDHHPHELI